MRMLILVPLLLFVLGGVGFGKPDSKKTHRTTENLNVVQKKAEELLQAADSREGFSPEEVLIIFDIDNTLLTMEQDLGGDAWWDWQMELLKKYKESGKPEKGLVGTSINQVIEAQYFLYHLGRMKQTQSDAARLLQSLQNKGFPVMAMTARGPSARPATLRELGRNGMFFDSSVIKIKPHENQSAIAFAEQHYPSKESLIAAAKSSGDVEMADRAKNLRLRKLDFTNGVMMVSGMDKGLMTHWLLSNSSLNIKSVIFIDDSPKNVANVVKSFDGASNNIEAHVFYYDAYQSDKEDFLNSKLRTNLVADRWSELKAALDNAYMKPSYHLEGVTPWKK